jgi:hypothetical protein
MQASLTPDGHTNMEFWNFARRLVDSPSTAEASTIPTEGHTIASDPQTIPTEVLAIVSDPQTKSPQRYQFLPSSLPTGHAKVTTYFEYDAFVRGNKWPPGGIKPLVNRGKFQWQIFLNFILDLHITIKNNSIHMNIYDKRWYSKLSTFRWKHAACNIL